MPFQRALRQSGKLGGLRLRKQVHMRSVILPPTIGGW
jgi:hypothetical protein